MHLPSHFRMTHALASSLSRGGKFIITPRQRPSIVNFLDGFKGYARAVRLRAHFGDGDGDFDRRYHVPNPKWQPPYAPPLIEAQLADLEGRLKAAFPESRDDRLVSNVPLLERQALRDLQRCDDIIVKPADKNLGLTLMGRDWYMQECYRQLGDTATYKEMPAFDVEKIRDATFRVLKRMRATLPYNESSWLFAETNKCGALPKFYILPKLHKVPVKGRPIVASCGWLTTPLSQWCSHKLNAIVAQLPTVLKDTGDLIARLRAISLPPNAEILMSTIDVESLYTSIPVDDAIIALHYMCKDALPSEVYENVGNAVHFVLAHNYISFDGKVFHQVKGLAMGTPLAPPVANIFMAYLEKRLFMRHPEVHPHIYVRFLDDIFVLQISGCVPHCALWRQLDRMHRHIKLTRESSMREIAMLDLVIYREGSRLLHRVHQKALNKYLYISPRSCHPPHVMRGFIRTELIRYARNCSANLDFLRICRAFSSRLRERGFHPAFLREVFATVQHGHYPIKEDLAVPMVFKAPYGGGQEIRLLPRVVAQWYNECPQAFCAAVPRPIMCYTVGQNIYKMLVRAEVGPREGQP